MCLDGREALGKRQLGTPVASAGLLSRKFMREPAEPSPGDLAAGCVGTPRALSAKPTHPPTLLLPSVCTAVWIHT